MLSVSQREHIAIDLQTRAHTLLFKNKLQKIYKQNHLLKYIIIKNTKWALFTFHFSLKIFFFYSNIRYLFFKLA
jgi:hypothetical protein